MLAAAVGIKLTSPGPIFYRAVRIGRDRRRLVGQGQKTHIPERRRGEYRGCEFIMYKFRTMHVDQRGDSSPITASSDSRVFWFGAWLRAAKVDELPQLLNVVKGEMALVGPRPEAPEIVRMHYTKDDLLTLQVLPGLTSPGTLYYYTKCEALLSAGSVVQTYTERVMPIKLAIDRVYLRNASFAYDVRVLARTVVVLAGRLAGQHRFADPPELALIGRSPQA
jgi:lipopolysaccharide/colanic/teichoic acid biosynthesis glycosyltransferase